MTKEYEHKSVNAELVLVQFDIDLSKRDGGTYPGTKIIYNAFNQINEKGIHAKAFEYKTELRGQLEALKPQDKFTLNLYREKDTKFWNVDSVLPGHVQTRDTSKKGDSTVASQMTGEPNPAAVGQVLNLALALGLVKSLKELDDLSKARSVVKDIQKAKANIAAVWDTDPEPANEQRNIGPDKDEELDDDLPF